MTETPTRRRWLRVLLPAVLILVWLAGAAIGGPYFGRVGEVSSNEQANYLPSSADATKVQALLGEFNDSDAIPAIVVFTSEAPLSEADLAAINAQVADLPQLQGVADGVSPAIPSEDGLAVQVFVPISSDVELSDVVSELGQVLR